MSTWFVADTGGDVHAALKELRAARRRQRIADIEWFEAAYRVYLTAIVGSVITLAVSGVVGDARLDATGIADAARRGPAIIGLVAAVAIALGLRSGSRGGPLALESAEVRYVLMAPVDRRRALMAAAVKQVRYATFVGAVVGAVIGQLASRRLGGNGLGWIACGALVAALIAVSLVAAAMIGSGARIRRWQATLIGAAIIGWAAADVAHKTPAPTTAIGDVALWPVRFRPIDLLGIVAIAGAVAVGVALLGRVSLELAERRTGLVGQLRFAVTVRDLRTVVVLRRQLAQEKPRPRPWFVLPGFRKHPVWRRGMHSFLRFPATRLLRLALLAGSAGLALSSAFHGTTPLLAVAGIATYLAGLDLIEPLAQEYDQSDRAASYPVVAGRLRALQLVPVAVAAIPVAVVGGAAAWAINRTGTSLKLAAIICLPAIWCGVAGAAVSVTMGGGDSGKGGELVPPEVAGMMLAVKTAWPVIVSIVGTLPVIAAQRAARVGHDPVGPAIQTGIAALLLAGACLAWVRFREEAMAWFRNAQEESKAVSQERRAKQQGTR